MCEVWRGQHQHQGTPVAIKIVLANHARRERYIRTFRDEVRAVAGLHHPFIVQVFDYGVIPSPLPEGTPPQLVAGSPYLVMELGDDTLRSWCGHLDWPHLYHVLLSLLDALSHAHAQGVIHRDIKPGNILQCQGGSVIKLTDFGLAHTVYGGEHEQENQEIIGTPAYMAPEQFERRWRDYGPWTDLYALGCTAYALLTGEPPFGQLDQLEEMMRSHLFRAVPALPHPERVPPHFEPWLRCLLAKSPTARFQRAADAAWALMELSRDWHPPAPVHVAQNVRPRQRPEGGVRLPALPTRNSRPPAPWDPHTLSGGVRTTGVFPLAGTPALHMLKSLHQASTLRIQAHDPQNPQQVGLTQPDLQLPTGLMQPDLQQFPAEHAVPLLAGPAFYAGTHNLSPPHVHQGPDENPASVSWRVLSDIPSPLFRRPPWVEDWRRTEDEPSLPPLRDVGLGLYGLRAIPWAGRESERDRLWQILLQVCRKQSPHILLLQGPAGCGKSRLARWLCERAHEVGTATYLKTQFNSEAGPEDGFEASLLRYLRGMDLTHDELCDRISLGEGHRLGLSREECRTLSQWIFPRSHPSPSYEFLWSNSPSTHPSPRDTMQFHADGQSQDTILPEWSALLSEASPSERDTQPAEDHLPEGQLYPDFDSSDPDHHAPPDSVLDSASSEAPSGAEDTPLWMIEETWCEPTQLHPIPSATSLAYPSHPHPLLERYQQFSRFLQRLSQRRPVIVWIDEAHWSQDPFLFAHYILQQPPHEHGPILLVLTLQDDILAEQPDLRHHRAQLLRSTQVSCVDVGPLSREHHSILIRNLLGLQGELAAQVEKRTAGNPQFAVQLVGDWVQRGLLEPTDQGFCLKPGVHITIPDDLYQVWQTRIARVLEKRAPEEKMVLELAAVLGPQVDVSEWQAVCQIVGVPMPDTLLEQLLEQHLARRTSAYSENWSFVHPMLQESLQRQAQEANRLATHHWICAIMLQRKSGRGIAERLGRHLKLAGKSQDALTPLLQGLRERESSGEYNLAIPLLHQWEELLQHVSWPPEHPYWGELRLLQAQLARGSGDLGQTFILAEQAHQEAHTHHWPTILVQSLLLMIHTGIRSGQTEEQLRAWLVSAESLATTEASLVLCAETSWTWGEFFCLQGRLTEAEQRFYRAFDHFCQRNDTLGMGRSHYGLAHVARQALRLEQTQQHLELAQHYFEAYQSQHGMADCLSLLGDLCRAHKQLAPALEYYRSSLQIYEKLGSGDAIVCELNIALVLLQQQNYAEAQPILERILPVLERRNHQMLTGAVHAFLLCCCAQRQDWEAWQHHLSLARHFLAETQHHSIDLADTFHQAGLLAEKAEVYVQAQEAYLLSLHHWEVLQHPQQVQRLRQHLARITAKLPSPAPAASLDTPAKGTPLPRSVASQPELIWLPDGTSSPTVPIPGSPRSTAPAIDPLGPTQRSTAVPLLPDEPPLPHKN